MKHLIWLIILSCSLLGVQVSGEPTIKPVDKKKLADKEINGSLAPYVTEYCKKHGIPTAALSKALFGNSAQVPQKQNELPVMIASEDHKCGNDTFFKSTGQLIYEIAPAGHGLHLVLFSHVTPYTLLTKKESPWAVALINDQGTPLLIRPLITKWKYTNATLEMWDMIYTFLKVTPTNATPAVAPDKPLPPASDLEVTILVRISYVHTGGGGGRDQQYTAKSTMKLSLEKIHVEQTGDGMKTP